MSCVKKSDILFIILIPAFIVFLAYTTKSFWGDEILSLQFASKDFDSFIHSLSEDYHPPLYFVLLKIWIAVLGQSEILLRMFQGMQGMLFIFLSLALFRKFFPDKSYHPLWIVLVTSSEIWLFIPMLRYYIFAACLVMFSSLIFFKWLQHPTRKNSLLLLLSYIFLLYTDYPSSIIILLHGLFILLTQKHLFRKLGIIYTTAMLLFLPWISITINQIGSLLKAEQIADLNNSPKVILLKLTFSSYAFVFGEMIFPFEIFTVVIIILLALTFFSNIKLKGIWSSFYSQYALSVFIVGIVFTSIITTFISKHTSFIYTPSRSLFALPFLFLWLGGFYSSIKNNFSKIVFITALLLANIYGIYNWAANRHFMMPVYASPWKDIMKTLEGEEGLILVDESFCYEYYVEELKNDFPKLIKASSVDELRTELAQNPRYIFLILTGRESTKSEIKNDIIGYITKIGILIYERKYLQLEESYRKIKSKIFGRDTYDAKFVLYKYKLI